jgi:hypothetical protein
MRVAVIPAAFTLFVAAASDAEAIAISANIQARHLPWGTIVDPFYVSATSETITGYTRCGDSAIWTGHYLAAESFRYAVTRSPEALAAATGAIESLHGLVTVTGTGLLARCRIATGSRFADGIHREEASNGVFTNNNAGYTWIGNPSRDQYLGAIFGLGIAYELIPERRAPIRDAVTAIVEPLVASDWNPRGGPTFLLRPDQVLGILQVARLVNRERFGEIYASQRVRLAGSVGTPVAFDSLSTSSYFKFNLIHITFYHLVRHEEPESRGVYERAFAIARNYTAGHQNAFFNMVDAALFGIDGRRDRETVALLDLWLKRPRRDFFVDLRPAVRVCGDQACDPISVDRRTPTDFLWQRNPFQLSGGGAGTIGNAGVDYILPYWMARYYGVAPAFAAQAAAPDAIISLYGAGIDAERVVIRDSQQTDRAAVVFYTSSDQINLHIPAATALGPARITLNQRNGGTQSATVNVANVAPFVFAIIPEGRYAVIYATGIRRGSRTTVTANGVNLPVLYAGPQPTFIGLDQINVEFPAGVGLEGLVVSTDGIDSNRF